MLLLTLPLLLPLTLPLTLLPLLPLLRAALSSRPHTPTQANAHFEAGLDPAMRPQRDNALELEKFIRLKVRGREAGRKGERAGRQGGREGGEEAGRGGCKYQPKLGAEWSGGRSGRGSGADTTPTTLTRTHTHTHAAAVR